MTTPESDGHFSPTPDDDETDYYDPASQRLLPGASPLNPPRRKAVNMRRSFFIRCLALLCAMSLSVGSH